MCYLESTIADNIGLEKFIAIIIVGEISDIFFKYLMSITECKYT